MRKFPNIPVGFTRCNNFLFKGGAISLESTAIYDGRKKAAKLEK